MAGQSRRPEYTLGMGGDYVLDGVGDLKARWAFLEAVQHRTNALVTLEQIPPTAGPKAIDRWCTERGFTDAWLRTVAHKTASYLRSREPGMPAQWQLALAYWAPIFPGLTAWDPLYEREAHFRARVDSYIAEMKRAPGLKRAPRKRLELGDTPHRDFEWLALYQVGQQNYQEIADAYKLHEGVKSVEQAVKRTAALVGIVLRSQQRGRRPKTPTQKTRR